MTPEITDSDGTSGRVLRRYRTRKVRTTGQAPEAYRPNPRPHDDEGEKTSIRHNGGWRCLTQTDSMH